MAGRRGEAYARRIHAARRRQWHGL
jgi:hypothetical protein